MVFVCNLQSIHSLANVVILFAIKTCQPCHYIKPIARAYTRECHENKNTRFWATHGKTRNLIGQYPCRMRQSCTGNLKVDSASHFTSLLGLKIADKKPFQLLKLAENEDKVKY